SLRKPIDHFTHSGGCNQISSGGPATDESGATDRPPSYGGEKLLLGFRGAVAQRGIEANAEHRQQDMDNQSRKYSTCNPGGIMSAAQSIDIHRRLSGWAFQGGLPCTLADCTLARE